MAAMTFKPATVEDAQHIAAHLRQADRDELAITSPGKTGEQVLLKALETSRWATVACVEGEPAIAYGVAATPKLGVGAPWLLATDRLNEVEREFVFKCRSEVDLMLQSFSVLTNATHRRNTKIIRWLEVLGFTVMHRHPLGELLPFFKRAPAHV